MRRLIGFGLGLALLLVAGGALAQTPTVVPIDGSQDSRAWKHMLVRVDPASLNLGASEEVAVTVPGIQLGDPVFVFVPASLEAALVHSGTRVTQNNTVAIRITSTVNATNGAARDWQVIWYNRTQAYETPGPAPTPTNTP